MNVQYAKRFIKQWMRREWYNYDSGIDENKGVAIVFVNYNTINLTAYLLFSIFRFLGSKNITRIVAIDNNSTDGSRELLKHFAAHGLIDLILNGRQNYHGPAINQGITYLSSQQKHEPSGKRTRYIWILDSDVILLRRDIIVNAVKFLEGHDAAAIGQFQYDALPEGYAHISSLLIDPVKAWRRRIAPFDHTGAPAANFQRSLRAYGLKVCDFPFRDEHYLLHLARGTLKTIYNTDDRKNVFYEWAKTHSEHDYHGDPKGKVFYENFVKLFNKEVPELSPDKLLNACCKPDLISIHCSQNK